MADASLVVSAGTTITGTQKIMSKVYEALLQKERENCNSRDSVRAEGTEAVVDLESFIGGLERPIEVTAGAISATDELLKAGNDFGQQFDLTAETPKNSPIANCRRLKLTRRDESPLVFLTDAHGLAAEQFRLVRRRLEQKFPNGAVLLITSPAPKDGKTQTALNLSACLADSGRPTLLLEGDIRQPSIQGVLGERSVAPGIEDALAGTVDPAQSVHFVEDLSLYVAMAAEAPADPSHLIAGSGTKRLLGWARQQFYWVVIDSPPVLPAADVTHLVTMVDAVLLVVRAEGTPRELTIRTIESLGDRLSGVILNEANLESTPYYRYLAHYRQKTLASSGRAPAPSHDPAAAVSEKAGAAQ